MDITIYLPDELATRAKEAGLNLSGMLRQTVTIYFEEQATVESTLKGAREITIEVLDSQERRYRAKFVGVKIADDDDTLVYLTDDQEVILYDGDKEKYWVVEDPESELIHLSQEAYLSAMDALGIVPTVELSVSPR